MEYDLVNPAFNLMRTHMNVLISLKRLNRSFCRKKKTVKIDGITNRNLRVIASSVKNYLFFKNIKLN